MPLTKIYHAAKQHDGGRASDHLHINLKSHFQRILRCILFYCRLRKLNNHQHLHFHSTSTLSLNIFTFTLHSALDELCTPHPERHALLVE
jgi:hypothetical protein